MGDQPVFDAYYYAHSCGRPYGRDEAWLRFFATIADRIVADLGSDRGQTGVRPGSDQGQTGVRPGSDRGQTPGSDRGQTGVRPGSDRGQTPLRVLDAGCAMGLLVEALVERGADAYGVDISEYAISQAAPEVRNRCHVGSLTTPLDGHFDLVVCIEVLEHMPANEAAAALKNICAHTDDVLFSSSPTDFSETTHVNVQPPEAWAEAFAREGLLRDLDYDASFITPWAVRYRRRHEALPRVVREYERAAARLTIERNELRQQVVQFDRHVQNEAAEAPKLRSELARVNEALLAAQQRNAALEDTVHHMEASAFWRLRNVWRSIASLFGGGR